LIDSRSWFFEEGKTVLKHLKVYTEKTLLLFTCIGNVELFVSFTKLTLKWIY
jgi:hypothetical protein